MGKYIIIAIVVIIFLGGGFYFMNNKSAMQQQTASSQQTSQQTQQPSNMKAQPTSISSNGNSHDVSYTANGFEPQTITIKAGQTVTWTNKDSDDVWVASNPHPTHTDYPGFDELKSMSNGQTYSFTFTKVGHWGYHNHLSPSQMGVVIVTQ